MRPRHGSRLRVARPGEGCGLTGRGERGCWQHHGTPDGDSTVPWIANGAEMQGCGHNRFPAGREECSRPGGEQGLGRSRQEEPQRGAAAVGLAVGKPSLRPIARGAPGQHSQPSSAAGTHPGGNVPGQQHPPVSRVHGAKHPGCALPGTVPSGRQGWPRGAARVRAQGQPGEAALPGLRQQGNNAGLFPPHAGAAGEGCPCAPGEPITLGSQHLLLGAVGSVARLSWDSWEQLRSLCRKGER